MPIICVVCGAEVPEAEYPSHMDKLHPSGQIASVVAKKNIPKAANLPPGINPGDLPNKEFLQTIEEMEKEASKPRKPVISQPMKPQAAMTKEETPTPVANKKPLKLTYKWEGNCETCGNTVKTIVIENYAVAYCLNCDEDVKKKKVQPLYQDKLILIKENIEIKKAKGGKKHGKSSDVSKTSVPSQM